MERERLPITGKGVPGGGDACTGREADVWSIGHQQLQPFQREARQKRMHLDVSCV